MTSTNIAQEYRQIYDDIMGAASEGVILTYDSVSDVYDYRPFSHNAEDDCIEQLGELMRKNLLFYCYGEDEIVTQRQEGKFSSLEQAAKFAYKNRLPQRSPNSDGLPGEVLLDLLVQLYEKDAYKLAVRPLLRQNDNVEIKGYDLAYFTLSDDKITLWLGQAKLGAKDYCKSNIHKDLCEKYEKEYLTKQLFFVCDKRVGTTEENKIITDVVNEINLRTYEQDDSVRAASLLEYFRENNISIKIPCLLAYEENDVYKDKELLCQNIEKQLKGMRKFFSGKKHVFERFAPQIILYIFPLKNIGELRDNERGFYSGLC